MRFSRGSRPSTSIICRWFPIRIMLGTLNYAPNLLLLPPTSSADSKNDSRAITMPKSISISPVPGVPGQVYYPLSINNVPKPTPKGTELLIKLHAYITHLLSIKFVHTAISRNPLLMSVFIVPLSTTATSSYASRFTQLLHLVFPSSPMAVVLSSPLVPQLISLG